MFSKVPRKNVFCLMVCGIGMSNLVNYSGHVPKGESIRDNVLAYSVGMVMFQSRDRQ